MTLGEAVRKFEAEYNEVKMGFPGRLCETGEEYTVIMNGGTKAEGEMTPCYCTTKEDAVRLWAEAVRKYAADKKGTLYWRHVPELEEIKKIDATDEGEPKRSFFNPHHWAVGSYFIVYSRLLISDKKVV